nr:ClassA_beta_lactamase [uncultured bacterium]
MTTTTSAVRAQQQPPLERAIKRLAESSGGIVGVSAIHIESGRRVSVNGDLRFPMASVYKLPIALRLLQRIDRGELRLDDPITLSTHDFRPGHSPIAEFANNKPVTLPLERLLELMLGESDNSASDLLLRLAGGPAAVTNRMQALGIMGINVSRPEGQLILNHRGVRELPPESEWTMALLDSLSAKITPAEREAAAAAYADDPRDTSTPDAMADLLVRIHRRDVLEPASMERLLQITTATQTGPARLKGLLPIGTVVAHKTGTMGGTTNDVGIVTLPDGAGHLAIAVFVKASTKDVPERERAIAELARTVYDFFVLKSRDEG